MILSRIWGRTESSWNITKMTCKERERYDVWWAEMWRLNLKRKWGLSGMKRKKNMTEKWRGRTW